MKAQCAMTDVRISGVIKPYISNQTTKEGSVRQTKVDLLVATCGMRRRCRFEIATPCSSRTICYASACASKINPSSEHTNLQVVRHDQCIRPLLLNRFCQNHVLAHQQRDIALLHLIRLVLLLDVLQRSYDVLIRVVV